MKQRLKRNEKKLRGKHRGIKVALTVFISLIVLGTSAVFGINGYVKSFGMSRILSAQEASELDDVDCIIVLGCQVTDDGRPCAMLNERLMCGIELYELGASPKILMSGDHGKADYDEVNTMKRIAVEEGVPSEDVFMDHAGFSTYETVYRAKEIFKAEKVIIVTQEYHLYRALYIADKLGLEAYGVTSDQLVYGGQNMREIREILARNKDFFTSIFKPEPTFLGEAVPVSGNGNSTNDDNSIFT